MAHPPQSAVSSTTCDECEMLPNAHGVAAIKEQCAKERGDKDSESKSMYGIICELNLRGPTQWETHKRTTAHKELLQLYGKDLFLACAIEVIATIMSYCFVSPMQQFNQIAVANRRNNVAWRCKLRNIQVGFFENYLQLEFDVPTNVLHDLQDIT
jgi:hypothetical protein